VGSLTSLSVFSLCNVSILHHKPNVEFIYSYIVIRRYVKYSVDKAPLYEPVPLLVTVLFVQPWGG
jgi:hypothetical protein